MCDKPLVSVCIPTYNNARYIGKTIRSIINQTYKNIEIIVCDNASTDNTEEIVKSFGDERVCYRRNPETIICLANWNLCLKSAKADYIAIYHSDDIYEPGIVEKEMEFLRKYQDAGAVFCLDKTINEKDVFIESETVLPREFKDKDVFDFNELLVGLLKSPCSFLVAPTFMAKKQIFSEVGYFIETMEFGDSAGSAADTEMWLRISKKYKIGIMKERLIRRRVSVSQGSNRYLSSRTSRANHFIVLENYLNSPRFAVKINESIFKDYEFNKFWDDALVARNLVEQGRQKDAYDILMHSFSWARFFIAFKNTDNLLKLFRAAILLFLVCVKIAPETLSLYEYLKSKL